MKPVPLRSSQETGHDPEQAMAEDVRDRYSLVRSMLDGASDALFCKDKDGKYQLINAQGTRMLGMSMGEVIGRSDSAFFAREQAERIRASDVEVLTTREPVSFEEVLDFQGIPTHVLTTKRPWTDSHGNVRGIIGSWQDLTKTRRADSEIAVHEHRLRRMATEVLLSEERARGLLAEDLRMGLAQDIVLLQIELAELLPRAPPELKEALARFGQLLEQASLSARNLERRLWPPLQQPDLLLALDWLAQDVAGRHALGIAIDSNGPLEVSDERTRVILYHAVNELLTHVVRPEPGRKILLRCEREDGLVRLTLVDRPGVVHADDVARDDALFGIQERLRTVGGTLRVHSGDEETTLTLVAPSGSAERGSGA